MALTKVGPKYQVTIPKAAREAAGLDIGDFVDAIPQKDGILLRPKTVIDRHPEIEARLREAEADIKAGRVYGPFSSAKELTDHLHKMVKARQKAKKPR
jgi:AbrB family looped-hinge helix DNA binding protein